MSEKNYLTAEGDQPGSIIFVHNKYRCGKDRTRHDITYVKCVLCSQPSLCPGRCKIKNYSFQAAHQHNHDQVEDIAMKTHLATISLKRKAEISSGNVTLKELFNTEIQNHQEVKEHLTFTVMEPALRKRRKMMYPTLPKSAISSVEVLQNMEDVSFNQYYEGSVISANDCCLIFMSPKLIEIMQEYNGPIFIDGTFKC